MNLNIKTRTVRYNNKILVSDGKFSLGETDKVNAGSANAFKASAKIRHKVEAQMTTTHKDSNDVLKNLPQKPTITQEEEKAA